MAYAERVLKLERFKPPSLEKFENKNNVVYAALKLCLCFCFGYFVLVLYRDMWLFYLEMYSIAKFVCIVPTLIHAREV